MLHLKYLNRQDIYSAVHFYDLPIINFQERFLIRLFYAFSEIKLALHFVLIWSQLIGKHEVMENMFYLKLLKCITFSKFS